MDANGYSDDASYTPSQAGGPVPSPDAGPAPWPPPHDFWRCLRLGGVSGRYEGGQAAATTIGNILDLRIDVDQRYNRNSPVMNRVSGDLYARRLLLHRAGSSPTGVIGSWFVRTYLASWIVDAPTVVWSRCSMQITGKVRYWSGVHPTTTIRIVVPWSSGSIGPAQVTFTRAGELPTTYSCQFRSDCFREVTLETDYCRSVNSAPQMPTYDTHAHTVRPADTPQRVLTIEEAYREAGIRVSVAGHTEIDDSAAGFATWSPAELHDAMEVAFSQWRQAWPRWHLWGILAGTFQRATTGGIMFDAGSAYGGSGDAPDRQGFAVFRNHNWFTNLVAGTPANQDQAGAMRQFMYTWAHEAGHAFNLLHSWDKARPDSLSWMNYDWKYDARNGVDAFWSGFRFRFDDDELIHMRHGDRASVIMGGDPWASGGHLDAPAGAMAETEPDGVAELALRSKGYFDFMEPVAVEARVRNISRAPMELDVRLDPEFGNTVVYVKRPDSRVAMFNSVMCQYGTPELVTLEPLQADGANQGRDRYSTSLSLTYGTRGFLFDEPGEYLLRAVYSGSGLLLTSNTLRIRIGHPMSRDEDNFAHDYFTSAVGLSLVVGGSQSPFLASGMDCLREAAERFEGNELGAKAAQTVAHSVGNDFYQRRQAEMVKTHAADPSAALALTEPAFEFYRRAEAKPYNLAYHGLVRLRAQFHVEAAAPEAARREIEMLRDDLAAREVNEPVLEDIRAFAESLE